MMFRRRTLPSARPRIPHAFLTTLLILTQLSSCASGRAAGPRDPIAIDEAETGTHMTIFMTRETKVWGNLVTFDDERIHLERHGVTILVPRDQVLAIYVSTEPDLHRSSPFRLVLGFVFVLAGVWAGLTS